MAHSKRSRTLKMPAEITVLREISAETMLEIRLKRGDFNGINGKNGVDGKDGIDGIDGKNGVDGVRGATISMGNGPPTIESSKKSGDMYLDVMTGDLYEFD